MANNKATPAATPKKRGRKAKTPSATVSPATKRGRKRKEASSEEEENEEEEDGKKAAGGNGESSSEDEPLIKKAKSPQPPTVSPL